MRCTHFVVNPVKDVKGAIIKAIGISHREEIGHP
jgi:hypothetical protein